jgi:16S rRNA (uracil1498-N3)-methyltransferase
MTVFYEKGISEGVTHLSKEESHHCIAVLRKRTGDEILVVDGAGVKYVCQITNASKSACEFRMLSKISQPSKSYGIHLAIAPTKNMDRMEWLVEKCAELGVDEISFIETQHAERRILKTDRLEKKAISALKQSKGFWRLKINPLIPFDDFLEKDAACKLIAYVEDDLPYLSKIAQPKEKVIILIGPEGDFSQTEVEKAIKYGYKKVSLGPQTLRTETAGLIACSFVHFLNQR